MSAAHAKLLSLRPTNAAMRLGTSPLPLLNPRDLQRALAGRQMALLCAPAFSRAAVGGILSAARHADAVVGLAVPFPLGERDRPENVLEELVISTREVPHQRLLFLQGGPFRVRSNDERALETLSAQIYRYVDGGCSTIALDASTLDLSAAAKAYAQLSHRVTERELSLEVAALRDASGSVDVDQTAALLQTLGAFGVKPQYLRVDVASVDAERVGRLVELAREHGAELCVEDSLALGGNELQGYVELGVRKWDAPQAFAARVTSALPAGALEALQARAAEVGRPWTELLGALSEGLASPEPELKVKLEALAYAEAASILSSLGARGSSAAAMAFLSSDQAY